MDKKLSSIPHIIHYIWLGRGKLPESYALSRGSAEQYARGFEIRFWNEDNISEFNLPNYFQALMGERKFAFASDILRFYILEKCGGVYLDIDQVLIRDISGLVDGVEEEFFLARYHEVVDYYGFGLLGSMPGSEFSQQMISFYNSYKGDEYVIVNKAGSEIINRTLRDSYKVNYIKIFDQEYFYPLTKDNYTENTYAYHMANTSWVPLYKKILIRLPFYKSLKVSAAKILPSSIKKKLGFNVSYL